MHGHLRCTPLQYVIVDCLGVFFIEPDLFDYVPFDLSDLSALEIRVRLRVALF